MSVLDALAWIILILFAATVVVLVVLWAQTLWQEVGKRGVLIMGGVIGAFLGTTWATCRVFGCKS